MIKKELIFDGNEKQIFATEDPDKVIFRYKDVTLAYNSIKRARFDGKGALNNRISAILLGYLNKNGVRTHFLEQTGEREQLCRRIDTIPIEVFWRKRIAGTLAGRLGVEDGFRPGNTIVDLQYNNDDLEDPIINKHHAVALGLATYDEIDIMMAVARKAGALLESLFQGVGIELVDMKLEFGRASDNGELILSDEISPDTCRLWDVSTGERLGKDRFRLDLSDVVASYKTVLERLETLNLQ